MTITQSRALWELCRQGLPLSADDAERAWEAGKIYHLTEPIKLPHEVENLIEQCNWEIATGNEGLFTA